MEDSTCKTTVRMQASDRSFPIPIVRSKFIFLQCKKPFHYAMRSGERRMLPMVAIRKLGEVRQ